MLKWREEDYPLMQLYILTDPRNGSTCYVGITKNFKVRLSQHRNPKKSNKSKIAKLQRHLLSVGLTLNGEVVLEGPKHIIALQEARFIYCLKIMLGNKLKNLQSGGNIGYTMDKKSISKMLETRRLNNKPSSRGEDVGTAKLTETQVKTIYNLIKEFYTNREIIKILNLKVGITTISEIRKGRLWKYLWESEKMTFIPSLNIVEGALGSREKLECLSKISDGFSNIEIKKLYGLNETDLNRIRNRTLWKMAWNVYDNFYKK